jgi:hypothetical protein
MFIMGFQIIFGFIAAYLFIQLILLLSDTKAIENSYEKMGFLGPLMLIAGFLWVSFFMLLFWPLTLMFGAHEEDMPGAKKNQIIMGLFSILFWMLLIVVLYLRITQ